MGVNFYGGPFFDGGFFGSGDGAPQPRGNAGAIFSPWQGPRRRTEEDVRSSRERFGLTQAAAEVIENIVAEQSTDSTAAERHEALRRELRLRRMAYRKKYQEALDARMAMLVAEHEERREQQRRDEAMLVLLMAAASIV